ITLHNPPISYVIFSSSIEGGSVALLWSIFSRCGKDRKPPLKIVFLLRSIPHYRVDHLGLLTGQALRSRQRKPQKSLPICESTHHLNGVLPFQDRRDIELRSPTCRRVLAR